uniref:Uncharacterized protein n=1 Tax=Megaselia scalaris TaxID=36166 RepID=T1H069_MEGSC
MKSQNSCPVCRIGFTLEDITPLYPSNDLEMVNSISARLSQVNTIVVMADTNSESRRRMYDFKGVVIGIVLTMLCSVVFFVLFYEDV